MSFCQMSKIQLQVLGNSSLFAHAKVVLSWMNSNKSLFREAVKKLFVFFGIFPKPADPSPPMGTLMWILAKFRNKNVNFMQKTMATKILQKIYEYWTPPPYLGNIFKKNLFLLLPLGRGTLFCLSCLT